MSIFFDHHIIPQSCREHDAFRDIDKKAFDIDSPANRIYLPASRELAAKLNVSPHPSRHVGPYQSLVCEKLDKIAEIDSPDDRLAEIKTLIDAMRVGFLNGDLYTNVPINKTREEVDQGIAKVLKDHKAYLGQYPDQLATIRNLERRGADAGQDHLIKWLLYLDNPERQKLLDDAIARNPGTNITAGNRDLSGTKWSKFEASDPSSGILHTPGIAPTNPSDFPPLPGYSSPSSADLNEQEGFTRIDPRFTGVLPAFPAAGQNEQQFDRLPPTTAAPSDPLILEWDPATGMPLRFYENPLAGDSSLARDALPWLAGAAAIGLAAPFIPAWALTLGGILALSRAATAEERNAGARMGAASPGGGVFSTGAPAHNTLGHGLNVDNAASTSGSSASSMFGRQLGGPSSLGPEAHASAFADRFGNWTSTPAGICLPRNCQKLHPRLPQHQSRPKTRGVSLV